MRFLSTFAVVLLTNAVAALQSPHRKAASLKKPTHSLHKREATHPVSSELQYFNKKTEKFLVNGTHFPQVPFDIGESYSGLLPNTPHGNSSLFFWFFPSSNPAADQEVCTDQEIRYPAHADLLI